MTHDDEDDELEKLLPTPQVSPDLADRVMARLAAPAVPRPRRRWPWLAAAVLLAGLAFVLWPRHPVAERGRHLGLVRDTLAIGRRAIAVAEGGAELRWSVDPDGRAQVEQRSGRVFYRVEPGGAFVVRTPAGEVVVTGTCFTVEVLAMRLSKQHVISAGVGAALSAAVLVVVHEGSVRLANARGSTSLAAGEQALATADSAPDRQGEPALADGQTMAAWSTPLGPEASKEQILTQNAELRRQLAAAQRQSALLEQRLAQAAEPQVDNVDPSKEQLAAWAARCEVHLDAPDIFGAVQKPLDDKMVSEWGLSAEERPIMDKILGKLHDQARQEMRQIYVEATGNSAGADELTAGAMWGEVHDKAVPADIVRARQRLARERAGLDPAPGPDELAHAPPIERAMRLLQRYGALMESELARAVDPGRAHELRKHFNAWPGFQMSSGGCDE